MKTGWNAISSLTKNFSKDMLSKWRDAHYFTKDGLITGLGFKVMSGQAKNTVEVDVNGKGKERNLKEAWNIVKSDVIAALKKQGITV
jgi:hypothetical protein